MPILLLSAALTLAYVEARREALQDLALQHARSILRSVDQEIGGRSTMLQLLAAMSLIQDLKPADFTSLIRQAETHLKGQITLQRAQGAEPAPAVSVLSGPAQPEDRGQAPLLRLTLPVAGNGMAAQLLSLTMSPQVLQRSLLDAGLPEGWTAVVIDDNRQVIALSGPADTLLERQLSEVARQADAASASFWKTLGSAGEEVALAHARSPASGLGVGIMVPSRVAEAPLRRSLLGFGIGSTLVVALVIGLAFLFTRRIAHSVRQAALAARRLGQGESLPPLATPVRELSAVSAALSEAGRRMQARARELADSEAQLSRAVSAARMATWEWDCGTDRLSGSPERENLYNAARGSLRTFGAVMNVILPEDRIQVRAAMEAALDPCGPGLYEAQFRVLDPAGGERWLQSQGAVVRRGPDGSASRLSGVVMDVTQAQHAAERERRLTREVDHRARNILTVVQSVLRLSRNEDSEAFLAAVKGRVDVLARAHTLLSRNRWNGADLHELVAETLGPHGIAGLVTLQGPPMALAMAAVQPLAQVLHEIADNARRHGALSGPDGHASLLWRRDGSGLSLLWRESAGPGVDAPPRPGFGLRVVENTVRWQLAGTVELRWGADGLCCSIRLPERMLRNGKACAAPEPVWPLPTLPARMAGPEPCQSP
ncbi:HWE histidine kinase domain-containing protein [Teichococcus oryzae]|uniref:histidine kinase n=1 Tax=Teichococcus oryzae TaxID=1608942 RepID=A0A5B2TDC6_9PROT|nr:HWE histidine kinase domain-containing protein [Pseudoroseomonas oryzae]KAA2212065.1 PAS domain-containing protein [Pseudoroseomonas oryzae]